MNNLPNKIAVFPLSNAVFFPKTILPLNIFEKRYIQLVDDCMKGQRIFGMIQPKSKANKKNEVYEVGCLGKITSFNETKDGRYLIVLNGVSRFKILKEIESGKLYRKFNVSFDEYSNDINSESTEIKFSDLELIFKNFKSLFKTKGYQIDWKELEQQSLDKTINALSMASPFSLEEKQILLESVDLRTRKEKLEEILNTYLVDNFGNNTVQ